MTFNELIVRAGITPTELSGLTGINESRINDLASGDASILSIKLDELFFVARALDMTVSELVDKLCD